MSAETVPRNAKIIHYLFATQLVSMGAMEMSGPFWPVHLKSFEVGGLWQGWGVIGIYLCPMIGIMLTSSFWGRLGDRVGHRLMMMRALAGLALSQLALAFAGDVWVIVALRFVQGACAGFIAPAQAYGLNFNGSSSRARLFSYLQVSTNVGSLIGAVFGGLVFDYASFFWVNVTSSLLCTACFFFVWFVLPDVAPSRSEPKTQADEGKAPHLSSSPRRSLKSPLYGLLLVMGALLFARLIPQTSYALYVKDTFQIDHWIIGFCYGLQALGFVCATSLWARYFEGKSLHAFQKGMIFVSLAFLPLMILAGWTTEIGIFVPIYFVWGVLLGATTPLLVSRISEYAALSKQGVMLGGTQAVIQFSSMLGIATGAGFSMLWGYENLYFFVAVFYGVAAVLAIAVWGFSVRHFKDMRYEV